MKIIFDKNNREVMITSFVKKKTELDRTATFDQPLFINQMYSTINYKWDVKNDEKMLK